MREDEGRGLSVGTSIACSERNTQACTRRYVCIVVYLVGRTIGQSYPKFVVTCT
jgi:hypothetical protein